jgi:cytochrome c556
LTIGEGNIKNRAIALLLIGSAMLSTFSVFAEPTKSAKQAKDVTQFRQAILKLVKNNVGAVGAINKVAIPFDVETMKTNSLRLGQLSLKLEDYFKTETSSFNVKTEALDKIWGNQADFNDKVSNLTAAASNLNKVAMGGDTSQFKPAIKQLFKSCKGCHDNYKKD